MAQRYPTDRASLERDSTVDFFRASGRGGQNRHKVGTRGRLVHRPTRVTVTATERRAQRQNLDTAYERLALKLEELQREDLPRVATQPSTASRERRLEEKRRAATIKRLRSTPPAED